jgi:hypothetical protein
MDYRKNWEEYNYTTKNENYKVYWRWTNSLFGVPIYIQTNPSYLP